MTVLRPGEHADELISASLTGDLTEVERAALEQHLAGCARCRETLAAFRQERQLISGMRHLQPPADLGARVRAGIEAGDLPWWQRRSTLVAVVGSLGAVAAGLLAVVVLSNLRPPPVAQQSATPSASFEASVSLAPSPPASVEASLLRARASRRADSGAGRRHRGADRPLHLPHRGPAVQAGSWWRTGRERAGRRPGDGRPSTRRCRRMATGWPSGSRAKDSGLVSSYAFGSRRRDAHPARPARDGLTLLAPQLVHHR